MQAGNTSLQTEAELAPKRWPQRDPGSAALRYTAAGVQYLRSVGGGAM